MKKRFKKVEMSVNKTFVRSFQCSAALLERRVLRPGLGGYRGAPPVWQIGSKDESEQTLLPKICIADAGSTVVCWHPEPEFPYECTKPMPARSGAVESPLKVQLRDEVEQLFHRKNKEFEVAELQRLTFTNKHIWYPPARREAYLKKLRTKYDREGL